MKKLSPRQAAYRLQQIEASKLKRATRGMVHQQAKKIKIDPTQPIITEKTNDWRGHPTPEGVPPWPDTIESLFL